MTSEKAPVSRILQELVEHHREEVVAFSTIRDSLDGQGFSLLIIILAFPAALPLPYPPGFTTIVGVPLALFSVQMLLGFSAPWLPRWLGAKKVRRSLLVTVVGRAVPLLHKIEHRIRPRFAFMGRRWGEKLVGLVSLVCAILISIPVPFGHMLPGTALLLLSLGFLEQDGVTVIAGMCVALLGVVLDAAVIFAGTEALLGVFSFVQHLHG